MTMIVFPGAGRNDKVSKGLKVDGYINGKDEVAALNTVLLSIFPNGSYTQSFRDKIISDMRFGAYSSETASPEIVAKMLVIMQNLRDEVSTSPETIAARQWFIAEIKASNPGKNIEDIFSEVCQARYSYVSGRKDPYPYENNTLARISKTLYFWEYFPTLIKSFNDPAFNAMYKKIVNNRNITMPELSALIKTVMNERAYLLALPGGKTTYPTRINMLDTFLKTVQNITLLEPEQLVILAKQ